MTSTPPRGAIVIEGARSGATSPAYGQPSGERDPTVASEPSPFVVDDEAVVRSKHHIKREGQLLTLRSHSAAREFRDLLRAHLSFD